MIDAGAHAAEQRLDHLAAQKPGEGAMDAGDQEARVVLRAGRERRDQAFGQSRAVGHEIEGQDQHDQHFDQQRRGAGGQADHVAQDRRAEGVGAPAQLLRVERRLQVDDDGAAVARSATRWSLSACQSAARWPGRRSRACCGRLRRSAATAPAPAGSRPARARPATSGRSAPIAARRGTRLDQSVPTSGSRTNASSQARKNSRMMSANSWTTCHSRPTR